MKWDDLRIFLAVTRARSFSAAARKLGVNQSTVSRRLAEMERHLNTKLFERSSDGHILTTAGHELLALANNVEEEFFRIDSQVAGRDTRLSGRLRVTCIDMLIDRYLAPHLARFSAQHPDIELEVLTPFRPLDLMRREADVAIRASDDPPATLVGRRLFGFALAAYASADLAQKLPPDPCPADLDWIGLDSEDYNRRVIASQFPEARIRHRVDGLFVLGSLVREGIGVSALPCYWADRDAALRRIHGAPFSPNGLGFWVLVHPDVRRTARVRAFTSFITELLVADRDLFEGNRPNAWDG